MAARSFAVFASVAVFFTVIAGWQVLRARLMNDRHPFGGRREFLASSVAMVKERPATGFGLGNLAARVSGVRPVRRRHLREPGTQDAVGGRGRPAVPGQAAVAGGHDASGCMEIGLGNRSGATLGALPGGLPIAAETCRWFFALLGLLAAGDPEGSPAWTPAPPGFVVLSNTD